MLINKSRSLLVIGRLKIRTGEPVPGIPLTAGEKKGVEAFRKAGYLVEEAPKAASTPAASAAKPKQKAEAKPEAKTDAKPEGK